MSLISLTIKNAAHPRLLIGNHTEILTNFGLNILVNYILVKKSVNVTSCLEIARIFLIEIVNKV